MEGRATAIACGRATILFEIETNKSVMEVESPGSGVIRDLAPITGEPIAGRHRRRLDRRRCRSRRVIARDRRTAAATRGRASVVAAAVRSTRPARPQRGAREACDRRALGLDSRARRSLAARRACSTSNLADVAGSGPAVASSRRTSSLAPRPAPKSADASADRLRPRSIRSAASSRSASPKARASAPHFYLTAQIEMSALQAALRRPARGSAVAGPAHARA